jgi:hypothetical protein
MKLIESKTLGTAQASIEFTSIPQDGTDLVLLLSTRIDSTNGTLIIQFNGSSSNYSARRLDGYGSGSPASSSTTNPWFAFTNISTYTSNTFANSSLYIPNYTSSAAKSISSDNVSENNATAAEAIILAGLWNDSSAITSILIDPLTGNLVAGTIISLYKITKGSDGIVTTSP